MMKLENEIINVLMSLYELFRIFSRILYRAVYYATRQDQKRDFLVLNIMIFFNKIICFSILGIR